MKLKLLLAILLLASKHICTGQPNEMANKASAFLALLTKEQQAKAKYDFDLEERYRWHYVPLDDRKGISINEMTSPQKEAAFALMHAALSEDAYKKAGEIMQLDNVLKALENRPENDHYRDPGKYFFTIFGNPAATGVWGWRLDGHHLSFSFSSDENKIVSGTPGFMGANPAVVLAGPEKGLEILKQENELAFEMLNALNQDQLAKAVIDSTAPGDIITVNSRKALIEDPRGVHYNELNAQQKSVFIKLLSLYIHRYTHLFGESMMKDIEAAGMDKLVFAWAGSRQNGPGHKRYYRIKGPTIIIEYDNTQNNGNHVHTVVRDLKNDFGGDLLLEHYKKSH